jgi:Family of unknown function (DUF6101)
LWVFDRAIRAEGDRDCEALNMSTGGAMPAGSGRCLRLDPLALPVRFRAADAAADERVRLVELHRDGVILRRSVRGVRMAFRLPVSAFLGVAMRLASPEALDAGTVAVMLEHRDPALSVPLFTATDATDIVAEWRRWANVLGMPLLVAGSDGTLREPFARVGAVRVGRPCGRPRRRGTLIKRRPRILMRRKPGRPGVRAIHREREIIARN